MTSSFDPDKHVKYLRELNQQPPRIGNIYLQDEALKEYLEWIFPKNILNTLVPSMIDLGDQLNGDVLEWAREVERNKPVLEQFTAWGERIDKLHLTHGWREQHKFAAREGIVGLTYKKDDEKEQFGEMRRLVQLVRLMVYQPFSGLYACPLAMTDGAALILRRLQQDTKFFNTLTEKTRKKVAEAYSHLVSYGEKDFWTSGQWMTEKRGGSDVSNGTDTIAINYKPGKFRLFGYKWFSSATDCDITLALARIIDPSKPFDIKQVHKIPLSLFLIQLRKKDKSLNKIEIIRLQDQLGTRQLPTAELLLNGTRAFLISEVGKGVKSISTMLNVTRMYNASSSVGGMKLGLQLIRDYSEKRSVFGKKLNNHPLQIKLVSDMSVYYRGNLAFFLKAAELLSKENADTATPEELDLLRMFTPLLKLFTAKSSMSSATEVLEYFGGVGYMENSNIPLILRDGQVLTIWEGTTNVLCHDFARALLKGNSLEAYVFFIRKILGRLATSEGKITDKNPRLRDMLAKITQANADVVADLHIFKKLDMKAIAELEPFLRDLCFAISQLIASYLLIDIFLFTGRDRDIEVFIRWVSLQTPIYAPDKEWNSQINRELAFEPKNFTGIQIKDSRGVLRPKF